MLNTGKCLKYIDNSIAYDLIMQVKYYVPAKLEEEIEICEIKT